MAVFINNLAQLVKSFSETIMKVEIRTDISHMPVIGTRSITSSCRFFGVPDKVLDNVWGIQGLACVLNCSTLLAEVREMAHKYSSSTLSARIAVIFQEVSSWTGKFIFTVLKWEQRLLKSINGKAVLRAWFQLRINEMARWTYYRVVSNLFQMDRQFPFSHAQCMLALIYIWTRIQLWISSRGALNRDRKQFSNNLLMMTNCSYVD